MSVSVSSTGLTGSENFRCLGNIQPCHIQGIIVFTGTETRQLFSHMFVVLKKFKELFYPTQNGITASVSFVSLTLVVLNARSPDWLRHTQTQNADGERTNMDTAALFLK